MKKSLISKIFRFVVVGGIATIIDFVFLYIFKELFNFNLVLANTLAFIISVTYNYIASIKWVFDIDKNKNSKIQFLLFITFSVIGLILNNIFIYLFTDIMGIYYLISKIIATLFVMIFNFVTRKIFLE